ncbi:MAG: response regulator transcription factor [Desulfobacteraceae bacterium]|jgi:two-component system phosphate regulon response regulator PhoB
MGKAKILIVDDEEDILELIRYNLTREGFTTTCAVSGEAALKQVQKDPPDLIILDLMLPGVDGLEVARRIKSDSNLKNIPIVMLTAKGEEADVVTGLELGADDYIIKPFSPKIMIARIKTVLRRQNEPEQNDEIPIRIDNLSIHLGRRNVEVAGKTVELTFTEFQILSLLAKRPGWVFTRTQIVDAVRGDDYPVTDRSVDVQIVGLRKKLGDYGTYIQTVRGVGYRFKESK